MSSDPSHPAPTLGDSLAGMGLRRPPGDDDPRRQAFDAADRYLLDEVAAWLPDTPGRLVIIDDSYGALTLACREAHPRVFQDSLVGRLALEANARSLGITEPRPFSLHSALGPELWADAGLVLMKLPKSLAHLEEIMSAAARHAPEDVKLIAGGMVKHMTPAMNTIVGKSFRTVQASLARQKARLLRADGLIREQATTQPYPKTIAVPELGLTSVAHGAVFAHDKLDIGTRYLASFIQPEPGARLIVDLGCGTGTLAVLAARANPAARVIATDESAAAIASARATFAANGVANAEALWDDTMASLPNDAVDLVLCNPPFHRGHSLTTGPALRMFAAAARVLRPGGRLVAVYNHHLAYDRAMTQTVGRVRILGKNAKFTVAVATK